MAAERLNSIAKPKQSLGNRLTAASLILLALSLIGTAWAPSQENVYVRFIGFDRNFVDDEIVLVVNGTSIIRNAITNSTGWAYFGFNLTRTSRAVLVTTLQVVSWQELVITNNALTTKVTRFNNTSQWTNANITTYFNGYEGVGYFNATFSVAQLSATVRNIGTTARVAVPKDPTAVATLSFPRQIVKAGVVYTFTNLTRIFLNGTTQTTSERTAQLDQTVQNIKVFYSSSESQQPPLSTEVVIGLIAAGAVGVAATYFVATRGREATATVIKRKRRVLREDSF